MSYVRMDGVMDNVDSIYKAVLIGAHRAIELAEEAAHQARVLSTKPTNLAINELSQGKLTYKVTK